MPQAGTVPIAASRKASVLTLRSRLGEAGEAGRCAQPNQPAWRVLSYGKSPEPALECRDASETPGDAPRHTVAGPSCSSAAPRPRAPLPSGALGSGPTVQGESFLNAGIHPCVQVWLSCWGWEAGAPALCACLCSGARAPDNGRPAQDNRHEQISGQQGCEVAPITDTGADIGPLGAAHGAGAGQVQGAGAAGALLPREGADQGTFLVP